MKLFIWNEPYPVGYGGSFAFAVAETVEDAREQVRKAGVSRYGHEPDSYCGADVSKRDPDRVLDGPCAEVYEWSE